MLQTFDGDALTRVASRDLSDALEDGKIIFFPRCPFDLPSPQDLEFLKEQLPAHLDRKNVSYYPTDDRLVGLGAGSEVAHRARAILRGHADRVQTFLRARMPEFTRGWTVGTTSFRPLQEKGRRLSAHASNERVHIDAGAYGATHGKRILRFFVNVNPVEDRVWATRGTFIDVLSRHGHAAGIVPPYPLAQGPWDRGRSRALGALERWGVSRARMIDSSPYDRLMRRLHNFMKDDPGFRDGHDGYQQISFPPFSAWAVLTDGVSHACLSGQHALVDTFLIALESCHRPEQSPYQVLQRGLDA